ncbi:MAG: beta-lactamase family protein [Gammaproteobacteria bacterium]|nr:beta-lactamase family protein [Gammaproteobacteria bacterium]
MKKLLLFLITFTLGACANQQTSEQYKSTEKQKAKQFQAEVQRIQKEYKLPGMTAAYVLKNGSSGNAASGFADVEAQIAMQDHPRMLAASIGKTYVAATTLALVQEGRLSLHEPVSVWLGKYPWFTRLANHDSITLHHLLTHSAGLADHVHMESFQMAFVQDWQAENNAFPPQRLIEFILDKPALFPVGQGWAYSDTGYILIGLIIETVTGNTYYNEVEKRFIKPLKLTETSASNRRDLKQLAAGYLSADNPFGLPTKTLDNNGQLYLHPGIEWTGGGLVSSSRDLAHWGHALFNGKVMSGDYRNELFNSIRIDPQMADIQYGAGVAIYKTSPVGPVLGHAGWIPGYISSLRHYMDSGVTIAFQINTDSGAISEDESIAQKIEMRLLKLLIK